MRNIHMLVLVLAVHAACWAGLGPPVPRSDDRVYLDVARSIGDGSYQINESPKNRRYTVILPALLITRLTGMPRAAALWALACSLATILLLYRWLSRGDAGIAVMAAALLSLNIVQVIYSTVLFPDIIVSLFMFCVAWCVFRRSDGYMPAGQGVLFFITGFFAKEIILLMLPFLLYVWLRDAMQKRHQAFWSLFFGGLVISYAAISAILYRITGDALFIVRSVEAMHNEVFVPHLSGMALWSRLTWEPLAWLLAQPGYVFLVILAIPGLFMMRKGPARFWKAYLLWMAAACWWGTTSLERFAPVLLYDRMWMPLLVPLCVAAAYGLEGLRHGKAGKRLGFLYAGLFAAAGIVWPLFLSLKMSFVFLAVAVLFLAGSRSGMFDHEGKPLARALPLLPYAATTVYFILMNTNH